MGKIEVAALARQPGPGGTGSAALPGQRGAAREWVGGTCSGTGAARPWLRCGNLAARARRRWLHAAGASIKGRRTREPPRRPLPRTKRPRGLWREQTQHGPRPAAAKGRALRAVLSHPEKDPATW